MARRLILVPYVKDQNQDYGQGKTAVRAKRGWFHRPRFYVETLGGQGLFGPYDTTWRPHDKAFYFDTFEEADEWAKKLSRTWFESYDFRIPIPNYIVGPVYKAHDGVKHMYLRQPFSSEVHSVVRGEFHCFYFDKYDTHGSHYILAVKKLEDFLMISGLVEQWNSDHTLGTRYC